MNHYPRKIRIHPLVIIGALASLVLAFQQEIGAFKTLKRNWRRAL